MCMIKALNLQSTVLKQHNMVCATVRIFTAIQNIQLKVYLAPNILSNIHFNILLRPYKVQSITSVMFIIKLLVGSSLADIIKCLADDN